jgi:threonine/homoserine/homoserine lactone efflux protein
MLNTEFLLTSLVVVLIPGTGVIYTVSMGLFQGRRAGVAAAVGCTAGILPHLTAAILGLSAILHMSALVFQVIKYIGTAYLLYMAWSMWRDTGTLKLNAPKQRTRIRKVIVRGILINILNPKLSIFFLAFLPLFIRPDAATPTVQLIILSAVFMGMTLAIFVLYGLSADRVRAHMVTSPRRTRRLQRSFALIFAGLGAKLAFTNH